MRYAFCAKCTTTGTLPQGPSGTASRMPTNLAVATTLVLAIAGLLSTTLYV